MINTYKTKLLNSINSGRREYLQIGSSFKAPYVEDSNKFAEIYIEGVLKPSYIIDFNNNYLLAIPLDTMECRYDPMTTKNIYMNNPKFGSKHFYKFGFSDRPVHSNICSFLCYPHFLLYPTWKMIVISELKARKENINNLIIDDPKNTLDYELKMKVSSQKYECGGGFNAPRFIIISDNYVVFPREIEGNSDSYELCCISKRNK